MKNSIKTPRKWNAYKYEATPEIAYFKKRKEWIFNLQQ